MGNLLLRTGVASASATSQLVASSVIDVTDFGVVGDGATNNDEALIAMRDQLLADDRHACYQITFPSGHFVYTNNRWKEGLTCYSIVGEDDLSTKLHCDNAQPSINDYSPFPRQGMFSLQGDRQGTGGEEFVSGDRIETVLSGESQVTLMAGAVDTYKEGDDVLIHSHCILHFGYSPSLNHYEFRKVQSVLGDTITLTSSLVDTHKSTHVDFLYSDFVIQIQQPQVRFGAARILQLTDRQQRVGKYFIPQFAEIKNIDFVWNANQTVIKEHALTLHGLDTRMENLKMTDTPDDSSGWAIYIRESLSHNVKNVEIDGLIELDKIVESSVIDDARLTGSFQSHAIKNGISVNNALIKNSVLNKRCNAIANSLTLDNCVIEGGSATPVRFSNAAYYGKKATINNCTTSGPTPHVREDWLPSHVVSLDASNRIIVDLSFFANTPGTVSYETYPWIYTTYAGAKLHDAIDGNHVGTITDIDGDSGTSAIITVDWLGLPPSSVYWRNMQEAETDGVTLWS